MVPLMTQLGLDARWNVIKGNEAFFEVTKKFHNALHGRDEQLTPKDFSLFMEVSEKNLAELRVQGDVIFIHDPQPVALVKKKQEIGKRWVWRCHIDVSRPNTQVWEFVRNFVVNYDAAIFSAPSFAQQLPIRQFLISPSIDPLSDKNKELPEDVVYSVLERLGIKSDKPMITQVSRFDYLKDPLGVIEAFSKVREHNDCQLILAGGTATDDPESEQVLSLVREKAEDNPDIHILLLPPDSNIEINALQRASTILVQKSLKEGFGLTVSEALWKGKPVVASAVGGIPLQIRHKFGGLLTHGVPGTSQAIAQLLNNPEYARRLGENGREHVKQNFLITRHIRDYLLLLLALDSPKETIYL